MHASDRSGISSALNLPCRWANLQTACLQGLLSNGIASQLLLHSKVANCTLQAYITALRILTSGVASGNRPDT